MTSPTRVPAVSVDSRGRPVLIAGRQQKTMTSVSETRVSRPSVLEAVNRLQESLDRLGDALATWSLKEVRTAGEAVAAALASLPDASDSSAEMGDARLPSALQQVEKALGRCRRVGTLLDDLVRQRLRATTESVEYSRPGSTHTQRTPIVLRKQV